MPRWTEEQQLAIDSEGKNIIVSAGAGSGKTAVLTARVLRKLKQGVDIDHLLILTFTKAAAAEMKERIRSGIRKEKDLKEQLDKIDSSYITTFDSYAFSIVKKYHYLLSISKNVTIGDSTVLTMKKKELLDQVMESFYEREEEDFLNMISTFCVKDDLEIRKSILEINNKLDLKYDKLPYLKRYLEEHFCESYISSLLQKYETRIQKKVLEIKDLFQTLSTFIEGEFYEKMADCLEPIMDAKNYEEMKKHLEMKLPTMPRGSEEEAKNLKEQISDLLKELKEDCRYESLEEIKNTILSTQKTVSVIIRILLELDEKIRQYKEEHEVYEFIDISKMAIQVLEENESVREELKYYFNEIMVDEYQDTNDLQEMFIHYIENDNVYMVGDIKQSIYRFRNANPYIFKDKYDRYMNHQGGMKIDLNKNFRSREEVLTNINTVFDLIMDDEIGGANYQESHRMVFGNKTYQEEGKTNQVNDFEILSYPLEKGFPYKKEEIEVFIIANDIKQKVENHYQVFDKDTLVVRDIQYSDFVILMDRSTQFDLYKRIFTSLQIPLTIDKDESMTNEVDLGLLKNLIRLIVLTRKKEYQTAFQFSYMAVARSYLYREKDEVIFEALTKKDYHMLPMMGVVEEIASQLETLTPRGFLEMIIEKFPFYEQMITVGNVENALNRFEYLLNIATSLEGLGYTVYDLDDYFTTIMDEQLDLKYSLNSESGNSCKIMTIHKSKGLEYPICYYSGLSAKFNISDLKSKFTFDNTYGFIVPYFLEGVASTIEKDLLKEQYLKDEISEKIRLFYVAMTRAKEKMILVASLEEEEEDHLKDGVVDRLVRLKYDSFQSILKSIREELLPYLKQVDLKEVPMNKDYNIVKSVSLDELLPVGIDELESKKLQISFEIQEEKRLSKKVTELFTKESDDARKLGLKFHEYLESLDLKNPNFDEIEPFYQKKLMAFCDLPIIKEQKFKKFYQEYEFVEKTETESIHGIIDLLLEFDDYYVIIDYKLKHTQDKEYQKQLNGYKDYIVKKTKKPVKMYLYSILKEQLIEVDYE